MSGVLRGSQDPSSGLGGFRGLGVELWVVPRPGGVVMLSGGRQSSEKQSGRRVALNLKTLFRRTGCEAWIAVLPSFSVWGLDQVEDDVWGPCGLGISVAKGPVV